MNHRCRAWQQAASVSSFDFSDLRIGDVIATSEYCWCRAVCQKGNNERHIVTSALVTSAPGENTR